MCLTHPTNLSVTAVGSGKLTVSWQEPLADGGSPIEGYKIQWKTRHAGVCLFAPVCGHGPYKSRAGADDQWIDER